MAFQVAPRSDLRGAFLWIALGAVVVFGSWRMDRMQQQGAEVYTAPGLWPGIVGLCIVLLGGFLVWRSTGRARTVGWNAAAAEDTAYVPTSRFILAAAMFFAYALLLVGHGLPFWLGTGLFVTAYIFVFRRADRLSGGVPGSARGDAIVALVCGAATALIVTLTFEQLFFVRLP